MFQGTKDLPTAATLERMADAATEVFLAAYGATSDNPSYPAGTSEATPGGVVAPGWAT